MQPEVSAAPSPETAKGLPAVVPPSGKFIAQLFLVPFLIVTVVVCFLLGFNWLVGSAQTPEEFLNRLDDANPDIRWRGAQDLAQVLLRNEQLASDPKFALDLADRLRSALRNDAGGAKIPADSSQDHVLYLSACLGNMMVPVGAPIISDLAGKSQSGDAKATARQRRRALWVLANLGQNSKRFEKLAPDRRQTVLVVLEEETTAKSGERAVLARLALDYLKGSEGHSLQPLGVEQALVQCAQDADPFLREVAAFAVNFWDGTRVENDQLEQALAKLARDDGRGEELLAQLREEDDKADEVITKSPGLKIRYNATVALARRGSDKVRLDVLQEMLDESKQNENFRLRRKNGQEVADAATASLTVVTALQAVAELHRKTPARDLSALYPALDELARNPNTAIRTEAERTRIALGHK